MPLAEVLVRAEGLRKEYRLGKNTYPALRDVTLSLTKGEFAALVGPSGSGKSTLLNLIGGLDRPTSGGLVVNGRDITKLKEPAMALYRQKTVGMVFQSFNLLPHLSALQNVLLPSVIADESDATARTRAQTLMERVGLKDRQINKPTELSGGEQQRVAIVRALMNSPKIILADEPTGNLDTKTGSEIINLLTDLCRKDGLTLLIVTHDERIASRADRVLHLVDGELNDGSRLP